MCCVIAAADFVTTAVIAWRGYIMVVMTEFGTWVHPMTVAHVAVVYEVAARRVVEVVVGIIAPIEW